MCEKKNIKEVEQGGVEPRTAQDKSGQGLELEKRLLPEYVCRDTIDTKITKVTIRRDSIIPVFSEIEIRYKKFYDNFSKHTEIEQEIEYIPKQLYEAYKEVYKKYAKEHGIALYRSKESKDKEDLVLMFERDSPALMQFYEEVRE